MELEKPGGNARLFCFSAVGELRMANLIFVGPPGAGVATQAARLVESRKVTSISYGEMVRNALRAETQFGRDALQAVDSGHVIPDNVIIGLVEERLIADANRPGYVLSGIPRTVKQAEELHEMLSRIRKPLDLAVFFDLSVEVMISRLLRLTPVSVEDKAQKLKIGYEHFMSASGELFSFYGKLGRSLRVDADLSPDDVAAQIEVGIAGKVVAR
jgi:adenylate kinase